MSPASQSRQTAVIIAAKNAADFIGRAVLSALAQPDVSEIVLVDDASTDDTADVAKRAAGGVKGDDRLKILVNTVNTGPAAARNRAIAASQAPNIAVLDADDVFLPGRLAALYAHDDWDVIADDIAFFDSGEKATAFYPPEVPATAGLLSFFDFVEGNLTVVGRQRGELGFLKPVFKRDFLQRHGIAYREDLRLGEDFELVARILAAGGRFRLSRQCGYGAVTRADSLSGKHRTEDLARLALAENDLLKLLDLSRADRQILERHLVQIRARQWHRQFLDMRKAGGLSAAFSAVPAAALPDVAMRILRDKAGGMLKRAGAREQDGAEPRYLLQSSGRI